MQPWRPSKGAIIGSVIGLCVVVILSFGLVFGIPGSSSSSTNDASGGAANAPISKTCYQTDQGDLFGAVAPHHYTITLAFNPETFDYEVDAPFEGAAAQFNGTTGIAFNVTNATTCVILHAANLTFTGVSLQSSEGAAIDTLCTDQASCASVVTPISQPSTPPQSAYQDLIYIDLGQTSMEPGTMPVLTFNYTGQLGAAPNTTGLYRSSPFCGSTAGAAVAAGECEPKVLVSGQFERTGARQAFPSYDMPASKAEFFVTLEVPAEDAVTVLSNAPEASRETSSDGSTVTVTFEATPVMSPYLVAIAVGDLAEAGTGQGSGRRLAAASPSTSGYEVQGWAVPGREGFMEEAVRLSVAALEYYDAYFIGVTQPVKKVSLSWLLGFQ